jgi:hypothetical protein
MEFKPAFIVESEEGWIVRGFEQDGVYCFIGRDGIAWVHTRGSAV